MGARVVITPGEITPASFSHPLLVAQKVVPQPTAADEPKADAPAAAKADKAAASEVTMKPAISEASLELKSAVGNADGAKPVMDEPSASTPSRERTQTADASNALPATKEPVTMTDATPAGGNLSPGGQAAAGPDSAAPPTQAGVSAGDSDAANADVRSEAAKSETPKSEAETTAAEIASSQDKPVETKSSEADAIDKSAAEAQAKADETKVDAKADDVKTEASKSEAPKSSEPKSSEPKSSEKPDDYVKAVTTDAHPSVPDLKKDQTHAPDTDKPAAPKPDPATLAAPKRSGQIAVFISRKDSKLYVRQNFAPLFDVPVTIASSERPLGTHVFTAEVDRNDANVLHWSVVSLPVTARNAERRDEDERTSRRRKMTGAVEMKPVPVPDSPAEALGRLTIPKDAMARITEALSTGSSIIVSDQGITAGETGEGTDFIVSLR
jgi:hypothetical protein